MLVLELVLVLEQEVVDSLGTMNPDRHLRQCLIDGSPAFDGNNGSGLSERVLVLKKMAK